MVLFIFDFTNPSLSNGVFIIDTLTNTFVQLLRHEHKGKIHGPYVRLVHLYNRLKMMGGFLKLFRCNQCGRVKDYEVFCESVLVNVS